MIIQKSLARILQETLASENTLKSLTRTGLSCRYRKILQLSWMNLKRKRLIYLRHFLLENWTNYKCISRIFQESCIYFIWSKILAIFCKNDELSWKILPQTSKDPASFLWQINHGITHNNLFLLVVSQSVLLKSIDNITVSPQKYHFFPEIRLFWKKVIFKFHGTFSFFIKPICSTFAVECHFYTSFLEKVVFFSQEFRAFAHKNWGRSIIFWVLRQNLNIFWFELDFSICSLIGGMENILEFAGRLVRFSVNVPKSVDICKLSSSLKIFLTNSPNLTIGFLELFSRDETSECVFKVVILK